MRLLVLALLLATACSSTGPEDVAVLLDGWWHVTLADGSVCLPRPFEIPGRDTPAEAIAECREAAHPGGD